MIKIEQPYFRVPIIDLHCAEVNKDGEINLLPMIEKLTVLISPCVETSSYLYLISIKGK